MIMRTICLVLAFCASCYRYSFEQRAPAAGEAVIVHKVRAPTYQAVRERVVVASSGRNKN